MSAHIHIYILSVCVFFRLTWLKKDPLSFYGEGSELTFALLWKEDRRKSNFLPVLHQLPASPYGRKCPPLQSLTMWGHNKKKKIKKRPGVFWFAPQCFPLTLLCLGVRGFCCLPRADRERRAWTSLLFVMRIITFGLLLFLLLSLSSLDRTKPQSCVCH